MSCYYIICSIINEGIIDILGLDNPASDSEVRDSMLPTTYILIEELPRAEDEEIVEEEPTYEELEILSNSSVKSYMCVSAITDKSSAQYKFIHESGKISINEKGYLVDADGYYGVALGSYFGEIGDRFRFTLDTGVELLVIKVEEKADIHTVDGFYHIVDSSVIEFVVDTSAQYMRDHVMSNGYIFCGNFNNNEEFRGKIVKIEKEVE